MDAFNYSRISKFLFLGSRFYAPADMEEVISQGVRAVLDLNLEKMDRPINLLAYLWLPARDFSAPSLEQLFIGVDFIDQLVRRRVTLYVHCNVGYGRAPTVVAAYLMAIHGQTLTEAITFLSHRRPGIHPNPRQVAQIEKFIVAFRRTLKDKRKAII